MSDIDLTQALAAARADVEERHARICGCGGTASSTDLRAADDAVRAAAPLIEAAVRAKVAADIETAASARATKRDEHREIAITRRAEGNLIGHDAHMRTALSFRSEATGMWDAAAIARGEP